ncbi:hypothetical protein CDD81_4833 [Ophiocordyceps australis]|uniref:Phosphoglycerate mutase family protein n=1 Tax=Ophiocordyceps australis TaxID=1399860 RepID=A0A2C5XA98_9HYPO|nr:hypothetical protein CDD81_4833 [Ophiocordyceps australis]
MKWSLLLVGVTSWMLVIANPTVYLIRHGEKPDNDDDHTLSARGKLRAQCLRRVFGSNSDYDIQLIIAERRKKNGSQRRPYDTVAPLAKDLGLVIDQTCSKWHEECVADVVKKYRGPGNILVCWEHVQLGRIAQELGTETPEHYPKKVFDQIWVDPPPYREITERVSEACPGLDDDAADDDEAE